MSNRNSEPYPSISILRTSIQSCPARRGCQHSSLDGLRRVADRPFCVISDWRVYIAGTSPAAESVPAIPYLKK